MTTPPNEDRKTLILTGASRGIGHATVKRFSSAGWRVITCSRHPFPEDCPWEMGPEDHIQVDLADPANTEAAIAEMRERLKAQGSRLNALVNNAAISPKGPGGSRLGVFETGMDVWQKVFQVNFFAPAMLARGLVEELKAAQGSVVNVTSIAGSSVHPFAGSAYSTSTAALAALTREMASDFGRLGIRVNAIAPGVFPTPLNRPLLEGTPRGAFFLAHTPMARFGDAPEIAGAAVYLASPAASYTTGEVLVVDGGFLARGVGPT